MLKVALVALLAALAGCLSAPPGSAPSDPQTFTTVITGEMTPVTSRLYLLQAPHMAAQEPVGQQVLRMAVPGTGPLEGAELAWSLPRPEDLVLLDGHVTLWVDVQGTVLNGAPVGSSDDCFWTVALLIDDYAPADSGNCLPEPATVPTGIRKLEVDLPTWNSAEVEGDQVRLIVRHSAVAMAPGARVEVLGGSPGYASNIDFANAGFPLTFQSLA